MNSYYKIQLNEGCGWYDDRTSNDNGLYEIIYFVSKDSALLHVSELPEFYEDKSIRVVPMNVCEEWTPYDNLLLAWVFLPAPEQSGAAWSNYASLKTKLNKMKIEYGILSIENLYQIKTVDEALNYIESLKDLYDRQRAYDYFKDVNIYFKTNGVSINDTSGEFERFNKAYLQINNSYKNNENI